MDLTLLLSFLILSNRARALGALLGITPPCTGKITVNEIDKTTTKFLIH
jgi:hypothetical protein